MITDLKPKSYRNAGGAVHDQPDPLELQDERDPDTDKCCYRIMWADTQHTAE